MLKIFKKIISMAIVMVMLLGIHSCLIGYATTPLFEENFETITQGDLAIKMGGVQIKTDYGAQLDTGTGYGASKSLKVWNTSATSPRTIGVGATFPRTLDSKYLIEYKVYLSDTSVTSTLEIDDSTWAARRYVFQLLKTSTDLYVRTYNAGTANTSTASTISLTKFSSNWFDVKIAADFINKKARVVLNGEYVYTMDNLDISAIIGSNLSARFNNGVLTNGVAYYDDIKITEGTALDFNIVNPSITNTNYVDVDFNLAPDAATLIPSNVTVTGSGAQAVSTIIPVTPVVVGSPNRYRFTFASPLSALKTYTLSMPNVTSTYGYPQSKSATFTTDIVQKKVYINTSFDTALSGIWAQATGNSIAGIIQEPNNVTNNILQMAYGTATGEIVRPIVQTYMSDNSLDLTKYVMDYRIKVSPSNSSSGLEIRNGQDDATTKFTIINVKYDVATGKDKVETINGAKFYDGNDWRSISVEVDETIPQIKIFVAGQLIDTLTTVNSPLITRIQQHVGLRPRFVNVLNTDGYIYYDDFKTYEMPEFIMRSSNLYLNSVSDSNIITGLQTGTLIGGVKCDNPTNSAQSMFIGMALYNATGSLDQISFENVSVAAHSSNQAPFKSIVIAPDFDLTGYTLKLFVWNDLTKIKPLIELKNYTKPLLIN